MKWLKIGLFMVFLSSIAMAKSSVYLFDQNISIIQNYYSDSFWVNYGTYFAINASYSGWINTSINCSQIIGGPDGDFCTDDSGSGSGGHGTTGFYLFNDTSYHYFNETQLNSTIDSRDDDTTYSCSDWAGCSDDSSWDADKLDGEDGSYYLDDTTIGNCSITDSCSNIQYGSEVYNCSVIGSCSDIAYDNEIIGNCSVDGSCNLITYDSELTYTTNVSCENVTGATSNLCTIEDTDTTIGNCSSVDSCDDIAYDYEIINNCSVTSSCSNIQYGTEVYNCSTDGSCSLITYDSELTYINNCTVTDSCGNIVYWGDVPICSGTDKLTSTDGISLTCASDELGGGGGSGDKWIDGGNYIYPNGTYADNINIFGWITALNWSNISITESQISDLAHTEDTNCSVTDSCSNIQYGDEVYNCSTEGSCSLITYDSELDYIGNCSVDGSCNLITYDSELTYTTNVSCENVTGATSNLCTIEDTHWTIEEWYIYDASSVLSFNETRLNATIENLDSDTTYSCSDWAGCSDDSSWDADKLDGEDGSYYLDDTTIGNCTATGSCSDVAYMNYVNTGNFNITGNITVSYTCFNADCSSYIYNNGTHSIWK